ncbi:MAG: response regulator [Anaerolineae bacterium]|jgi:pilus assembly protein CpaE|nr:response regulator [Anaerolineae bacterium]
MAENTIRVLLVDDIPETIKNISRMLKFDPAIEIVGQAADGREALQLVKDLDPDVVVMDINMPDMDGITATQHIRQRYIFTQVIILSVQSDPNYMRRAMRAGAHDFLSKPPMMDELTSVIKRAGKISEEQRSMAEATIGMQSSKSASGGMMPVLQGKSICIYSPKGGTGVTTIAANLAVAMSAKNNKVILVDGNNQYGSVPILFSVQSKYTVLDLLSRVEELDPDFISDVVTTHEPSGVDILAAPPRLENAEEVTAEAFTTLINYLRRYYHYVIVDTSSFLNDITLSTIETVDINVLVSSIEITSLRNANSFLVLYRALGYDPGKIMFILNFFDRREHISPERISESLHQKIELALPIDEKFEVRESIKRGIPLAVENRSNILSKNIFLLSNRIEERLKQLDETV